MTGAAPRTTRAWTEVADWYDAQMGEEGLTVVALEEPQPPTEFVAASEQGAWLREVPRHCLFEARKPAPRAS